MKILYCDDEANDRNMWCKGLTDSWQDLRKDGRLDDDLELQTCADITDTNGIPDSRSFNDVAGFDGFLLDLLWGTQESARPHGVEIAEELRRRYPEKAIMVFTVSADPIFFDRLLNAGICGYLRKGENPQALCLQITESMARHRKARGGQCLYRQLRELTSKGNSWAAESVGIAATDLWNLDRSHDRWEAFWNAFQAPIAAQRLTEVFLKMRKFFADADLLMFGTLPGMRGHLDHVLNVYFTGYVISNTIPHFRELATNAAKRLFPDKQTEINEDDSKYWDLFQLAWLAAATLHDTAYPLEIQPDLLSKCWSITTEFKDVLSNNGKVPELSCPSVSLAGLDEIATVFARLYDNGGGFSGLLRDNSTFTTGGDVKRVNHGVASGLLFHSLAKKAIEVKGADPKLEMYLKWAAAAMALHSLKIPGSKSDASILLERDPLSYLLLACDEIQVWDRERPDASRRSSPFKGTDLSEFSITDTSITACVNFTLHNGPAAVEEFNRKRESMDKTIVADNQVLAKYLNGKYLDEKELLVTVNRRVPSQGIDFAPLRF